VADFAGLCEQERWQSTHLAHYLQHAQQLQLHQLKQIQYREQNLAQKLTVKVLANPSANYFTLLLRSVSNSKVSIRISDASGKLIETKANVAVNSTLQLGNNYHPGAYYVVIVQGSEKAVIKLIKL
jgi:hypothetical protein